MANKRKPTEKDWIKIRTMYLSGVKPRHIIEKYPDLDLTAKALSSRLSRYKAKKSRKRIEQKVEEKLIEDIAQEQAEANRQLIKASKKIVSAINKYLENEQYYDFTTFNYGKLIKSNQNTLNTEGLRNVVKALKDAQNVQRLALDMDIDRKDNLPAPVINIDLGD